MGLSFNLDKEFVDEYRIKPEPFGFNGLGQLTFYRTYSRLKEDGEYESWVDVCERVINGMYSIQKDFCLENDRPWNDKKARLSAQEAFDRLFNLKWSPSGRGLWMLGVPFIHERHGSEALLNCGFCTTENIVQDKGKLFSWFMEMLMLGVGVASDVRGAKSIKIIKPSTKANTVYVIPDTREGWAKSVELLFNTYIPDKSDATSKFRIEFDYSNVRPAGEPIRGFGGIASGPEPLRKLHERMRVVLDANDGEPITEKTIVDIFNQIGAAVIAGNVRRSAELMLGFPNSDEFVNLKNPQRYPERSEWSWASNNSVIAAVGDDYTEVANQIVNNGEPGIFWLDNAQTYGRMGELEHDRGIGVNPCAEMVLEHYELCNLVEVYISRHEDEYDYQRTLKFAYLYGKTISLTYDWITHPESRRVMKNNRRVGLSNTGVTQFISKYGMTEFVTWIDNGYKLVKQYDSRYSSWLKIPSSCRLTTSKPSGTVSLLAGVTPGVHFPRSEYYIRRVRIAANSPMVNTLLDAGLRIEVDAYSDNTLVVEFPIHAGNKVNGALSISIWEQLEIAATVQKYWADNSVSVTVSFDPAKTKAAEVQRALDLYQYRLKTVSFLPEPELGAYEQMPYEEITKEKYADMVSEIDYTKLYDLRNNMSIQSKMEDKYCDGVACEIFPLPS